jgi:hypothetical protein
VPRPRRVREEIVFVQLAAGSRPDAARASSRRWAERYHVLPVCRKLAETSSKEGLLGDVISALSGSSSARSQRDGRLPRPQHSPSRVFRPEQVGQDTPISEMATIGPSDPAACHSWISRRMTRRGLPGGGKACNATSLTCRPALCCGALPRAASGDPSMEASTDSPSSSRTRQRLREG